jgi:hypothetical protein
MRAQQLLEEQADLLAKLRGNHDFQEAAASTFRLSLGDRPVANEILKTVTRHLEAAEAFYVTKDMSTLVQHAADGLEDEDLWDASLAPTGCGFVRFEKPLVMMDVRGTTMLAHWMTWGPVDGGTLITVWNDVRDPDDVVKLLFSQFGEGMVRRVTGHWSLLGGTAMHFGRSLGPAMIPVPEQYAEALRNEGITPTAFSSVERLVHALWLMLGQTIVSTREESVRDKYRHHAKRMNLPSRVTIIDLRRMEGAGREPGESHIEWQHRWLVRGHWRWQACGTNYSERRRIWVNGFVKGPEDKPLVVTDKVYALRR